MSLSLAPRDKEATFNTSRSVLPPKLPAVGYFLAIRFTQLSLVFFLSLSPFRYVDFIGSKAMVETQLLFLLYKKYLSSH